MKKDTYKEEEALSSILNEVRISDSFFVKSECFSPWGFENKASNEAIFHFVIKGEVEIKSFNGELIKLEEGDLILAPHGEGHYLQSNEGVNMQKFEDIILDKTTSKTPLLRLGENGDKSVLLCGGMKFSPSWHPLFKSLPTFVCLKRKDQVCTQWLDTLIKLMSMEVELDFPGSQAIITRLCESLVIESIRKHMMKDECNNDFSFALQDRYIGQAIVMMHKEPQKIWTVESLARQLDMSRTSFAKKFSSKVGSTPIQYLSFLRMNLAADSLKNGLNSIAQIAQDVGYESVVSFSRAFKKFWGESPGKFKLISQKK